MMNRYIIKFIYCYIDERPNLLSNRKIIVCENPKAIEYMIMPTEEENTVRLKFYLDKELIFDGYVNHILNFHVIFNTLSDALLGTSLNKEKLCIEPYLIENGTLDILEMICDLTYYLKDMEEKIYE